MSVGSRYSFFSDSEGPLCLNDNAFELAQHFIPNGDQLFVRLSAYDDYLVDVAHRPEYHGGDTLKLVLPFFKAYGVTEADMAEFSAKSVKWAPDAPEMLRRVRDWMPVSIVTTSYEQFAMPMYRSLGLRDEQIFCTRVKLDGYKISPQEAARLRQLAEEIVNMPVINPASADPQWVARLDQIFWQEICGISSCRELFRRVTVMSGGRKAAVIAEWVRRNGIGLSGVMFVGDSITDMESLRLVRQGGGLAVSFNGNQFALREAEIACISPTAATAGILAEAFSQGGRERAIEVIEHLGQAQENILQELSKLGVNPNVPPVVARITPNNLSNLVEQSLTLRRYLRGVRIGALG